MEHVTGMRPRRQSMDSETSSDSWSVIQKNVGQPEISSAEIDFEPSDSEHWDSDSDNVLDPHEYDSSEDEDGNDSLEECDESDGLEDDTGDCEIVDENEAMEETSSRYFISSEKVHQLLDMLNAECCSSIDELLKCTWPSSRDSTRAIVLLVFVVTTGIFFTSSIRFGKNRRSAVDRSDEIFAPGLQSRGDFGRAFMPLLPRRNSFNFSQACQPWQKSSWSLPPGFSAPIEPPTGLASYEPRNTTTIFEFNDISFLTRPVVTTGARISISRPARARRNVCSQPEVHRYRTVHAGFLKKRTTLQLRKRDVDEPSSRPVRPPPRLAAAPISISRTAKVANDVCSEKLKPRAHLPYPESILRPKKVSLKRLTGSRRPQISFKKSAPLVVRRSNVSVAVRAVPKFLSPRKKRPALAAPCLPKNRPCIERRTKPCKGFKALLQNVPSRKLSTYKHRRLAPSLPSPRRPCMDRSDTVQCWKSLQDQTKPMKINQYDWFTRRGLIRAENRRH
ncbi:hypothetical protein V3C99_006470 [Haemonchus contortus]